MRQSSTFNIGLCFSWLIAPFFLGWKVEKTCSPVDETENPEESAVQASATTQVEDLKLFMKTFSILVALLFPAVAALGQLTAPAKAAAEAVKKVSLTPGNYVLVYQDTNLLREVKVAFTQSTDGGLEFSSSSYPASPKAVFQGGAMLQFTLFEEVQSDGASPRNDLMFTFVATQRKPGVYEGNFFEVVAYDTGGQDKELTGTFILIKLSDKS